MSAALVRKALEISSESEKPLKSSKSSIKKAKSLKAKKKQTPEQIQKQNLKILKALEYKGKLPTSTEKKAKKGKTKTAFTDADFAKFEKEYFVRE